MKDLQNKKIVEISQQCAIKKIDLVVTPTGAVIEKRFFKGEYSISASYEKGKVIVYQDGKTVKTTDITKPSKKEDKKATKKEPKNDQAVSDVQENAV